MSCDKRTLYLVVSVAAGASGTSLASALINEACAALLAAKHAPSPLPAACHLSITSSSSLPSGVILVVAKASDDHEAEATLQLGGSVDETAQVFCQGTLSYTP